MAVSKAQASAEREVQALHERVCELEQALMAIRGVCLGNGPKGNRKSWNAVNEIVGYAVFGDFKDSKWVKRMLKGRL